VNSCVAAQRAGVDTTVLVPVTHQAADQVEPVLRVLENEGVKVHTFGLASEQSYYSHRWAISPKLISWLCRHLREYDVLHIHATWGLSQLAGVLLATGLQRPCVITPHEGLTSFDLEQSGDPIRSAAKRVAKHFYMRRAALLVFSSAIEARDSLPSRTAARAVVIPHPLRDALEVPRTVIHGRSTSIQIGFLGRLHEKKNLDVLMRAVRVVSDEARLLIAGNGPASYREQLRELAIELEMADRIEWCGFLDGGRRWSFLDRVDILAMPSKYECFGMVAAEAMARGTATVVSSETGIAQLIENSGGGLVAPPTVLGFSRALAELVNRPECRANLARRGARAARESLSLAAHGRAVRRCYEDLVWLA